MTRAEIAAELRRSAREDADPWVGVDMGAFHFALAFKGRKDSAMADKSPDTLRILFLLVAEAMND